MLSRILSFILIAYNNLYVIIKKKKILKFIFMTFFVVVVEFCAIIN